MSKAIQFMIHTLQSSGCKKNCLNESKERVAQNGKMENERTSQRIPIREPSIT